MSRTETVPYGDDPDQCVSLTSPDREARGTVLLMHGGYWRVRYTHELMRPLVEALVDSGWAAANVEYRRGPSHPWPAPLEDVRTAATVVAGHAAHTDGSPLVGMGHSVGGQLALLAGPPVDAVVALAPVTDVARTHDERLGEDAALEYFGVTPTAEPAVYADASPVARLPLGRPVLLVHGADDERVPLRHTSAFLDAALAVMDPVDALFLHALAHRDCLDPAGAHWPTVLAWLSAR